MKGGLTNDEAMRFVTYNKLHMMNIQLIRYRSEGSKKVACSVIGVCWAMKCVTHFKRHMKDRSLINKSQQELDNFITAGITVAVV